MSQYGNYDPNRIQKERELRDERIKQWMQEHPTNQQQPSDDTYTDKIRRRGLNHDEGEE